MHENAAKKLIAIVQPDGRFELDWQHVWDAAAPAAQAQALQEDIHARCARGDRDLFFSLAYIERPDELAESLRYLIEIASSFVRRLALNPDLEQLRERATAELDEETADRLLGGAPYLHGQSLLDREWLDRAWSRLHDSYAARLSSWEGSVESLLAASRAHVHFAGRIYFHLVENKETEEYPFSFMATYAAEAEGEASGKSRHLPLKNALIEYNDNEIKLLQLLSTVHKAAAGSSLIADLLDSGDIFHPIGLMSDEAYTFLTEVTMYEEAGILCRIPKWWASKSRNVKVSVAIGGTEPAQLGADTLLSFDAGLWLGGEAVSEEELRRLLTEAEGLVFLKGKWVEVNHKRLQEALAAYEKARQTLGREPLTIAEAMRLQLDAAQALDTGSDSAVELEVTHGEWFRELQNKLLHPDTLERAASPGDDFQASLRTYQERGVSWLLYMKKLGLGACLADDMGLGKTIQIIAMLNAVRTQRPERRERSLLIVPASLIGNWMRELDRFAPSLKYNVWHPSENRDMRGGGDDENDAGGAMPDLEAYDLVITTYGMLLKYDWLSRIEWDTLILDEAQAIKNPGTKQTRAVKQVRAAARIAMTGTPVENRLSDLWSLFDFLNRGMLGTAKEFTELSKRMREQPKGYQRLKQVVGPFILRRLKTDKAIISDLPDKIEMKTYAGLTPKQAVLYGKLVQDLQRKLDTAKEGIQRRGLILSSLLKFKQICNHPDQYLGQEVFRAEDSGKFARLKEICETILEKRERVLVFTQFKEMTEPLRAFLEQIFGHKGMVLHGGTPVARRHEIVAEFQNDAYLPFLVLSIKAGGVGLNLTKANHVIHFDRWWNPAVENQATDRAFRIGQQNHVLVHKFVTEGTIEEKIDQIIETKLRLTQDIVPDLQESWITEMDNAQLIELMKLSS
ncbi:DEAD/DEAH box helicase [Cohnella fermenti]|uniref:DEAD/DEAH box helicase n=1 Tax=Cohnella fermenti TaxID=2565925 RepID=A0A4V3WDV4_9BACL|nr:DEAD/DEAH box helicase [Cohnella fermenti]THF73782.1 DEAD/DEAH box helicase [Cohnella fermenti]